MKHWNVYLIHNIKNHIILKIALTINCLLFNCSALFSHNNPPERLIIIITCSYNNEQWYQWNLDSVVSQQYTNYKMIYIDDCSTDNTYELVKTYIEQKYQQNRITLIRNTQRRRALANLYYAIHSCPDHAIIVILDGDDRFTHDKVLEYINNVYNDNNVWLTYGQFKEYPTNYLGFCEEMPWWVIKENAFRSYNPTPSHLRTFYAGLFKQIKKEDLLYEDDFFPMTYDLAMMFPMIEMARNGHFQFIPDVLLEYNTANNINDHKVSKRLQTECADFIRNKPKYDPITTPICTVEQESMTLHNIKHIRRGKRCSLYVNDKIKKYTRAKKVKRL